ncbi:MAG TPA: penicillin-binding transpeptidase domain-containing protein [Caulobacteraceae bacterium]|nr:penicillin-binding transpeptidase domain-containing protein [Caulobacteraceae bacterium]
MKTALVNRRLAAAVLIVLALGACARPKSAPVGNTDQLETDIDQHMGGEGACVILADAKTGVVLYQYNTDKVCKARLPPCATFNIVTALIGLDSGAITPKTVVKWDGSPQPVKAWETDADLAQAWKSGIGWWFQKLAADVRHDRYQAALNSFGYGDRDLAGPPNDFWDGPQAGGKLALSTHEQVDFLRKLFSGGLPVGPAATTAVDGLMQDETRTGKNGKYVMADSSGACASAPDGSTSVAWWVGRLTSPTRDIVFAATINGETAPPGQELQDTGKDVFADAGLWPQG